MRINEITKSRKSVEENEESVISGKNNLGLDNQESHATIEKQDPKLEVETLAQNTHK